MKKNLISVIIPTYKGANFLPRAIASVLMQKNCDAEVIVVDDNSPSSLEREQTEKVMNKYKNLTHVHYIKHPQNMNGSVARNTGVSHAQGEYVSFLDDDDFYMPGRLEKCLDGIKKNQADLVYTDVFITKNDVPCDYIEAAYSGNLLVELLINENIFGTGSNLFLRSDLYRDINGFNGKLPRQQDYDFLLRCFANGAIAVPIHECLVVKAMNGTNNGAKYEVLKQIKKDLLDEYLQQVQDELVRKQILINQHRELLHTAILWKNSQGINEQKKFLANCSYSFGLKDKLQEIILKLPIRNQVQTIFWKRKSKTLKKLHSREYRYIEQYLKQNFDK